MNLMFEQEKDPARVITKATKVRVLCLAAIVYFCGHLSYKIRAILCYAGKGMSYKGKGMSYKGKGTSYKGTCLAL